MMYMYLSHVLVKEFKHQLKTNDTKIVWSEFNRDIVYKLLNSFNLYKVIN